MTFDLSYQDVHEIKGWEIINRIPLQIAAGWKCLRNLPLRIGLICWGCVDCLSETGTVSTDLLGSGLLLGLEPGGEPTRVNRTRDTLLWKKLSQLATLGYFTSDKIKLRISVQRAIQWAKCKRANFKNNTPSQILPQSQHLELYDTQFQNLSFFFFQIRFK